MVKSWIRNFVDEEVEDLSLDLRDGRILIKILEKVTNKTLSKTTFKGGQDFFYNSHFSMILV